MKPSSSTLLILSLISVSVAAHAQTVDSLTASEVTARDCTAGASGCDSISPIVGHSTVSGLTGSSTNLTAVPLPPEFAGVTATAGATISGSSPSTLVTPTLTATATSNAGTREGATAYALQSYTYGGTAATNDFIGGTVNYTQTINGIYPVALGAGTNIGIEVFTLAPGAQFSAGASAQDNYDALADAFANNTPVDSGITQTSFTLLGSSSAFDAITNPAGSLSTGVNVTLIPGSTVWVLAFLDSSAPNGSTVDPVFSTHWSSSTNLVAGVATVPEIDPATASGGLLLMLGSLAVLRGRRVVKRVTTASI
jgi:hypothetical protein